MIQRAFGVGLTFVLVVSPTFGEEIASNGRGGGAWSDPASWHDKKVPGPDDDAVILKGDTVDFDRDDNGKVSCRKLFIDPRGVFRLKTGIGKVTCCVAGPVDCRGLVQLDGTRSAEDSLELRFVAPEEKQRSVTLRNGASLIARGRGDLPEGRCNVAIMSPKGGPKAQEMETSVKSADGGTIIDLHRAALGEIAISAAELDNTGSRANERFSVVECRLTGRSRLALSRCDTAAVRKNSFDCAKGRGGAMRAILILECPLTEVRDNTIRGFQFAFAAINSSDATLSGNVVEQCESAFHFHGCHNFGVYRNVFRECGCALDIQYNRMITAEENRIEGAKMAVNFWNSTGQISSLEVLNLKKDGHAISVDYVMDSTEVPLVLINTNVRPEQIQLRKLPAAKPNAPPLIAAMNYLVVAAKDAPANAAVEVKTVNPQPALAPGAADLNVRNSPAFLSKGLTPVPRPAGTAQAALPLLVKSWTIDQAGKTVPAPEYEVRVVELEGGKPLKTVKVRPQADWFRAKAVDVKPTLEVTLK